MSLCFWAFRRAFFLRVGACAGQRAHDRDPKAKCAQGSGTRSPETIGKMRFPKSQPSPPFFSLQGTGWAGRLTYMIGISLHLFKNCQDVTASTRGLVAMTSAYHAEGRQLDPGRVYLLGLCCPHCHRPLSLNAHWATRIQNYTRPGSNWRPSACEADVLATKPRELVTICQGTLIED